MRDLTVATGDDCTWTASSREAWLSITAGANGSGSGAVEYRAAPSSGAARTGTIDIAGRIFTLHQGPGCTYSLSSSAVEMDRRGGPGSFTVEAGADCTWTVSSAVPWITVTGSASRSGRAAVQFDVEPNGGDARSGVVTAAGQAFTVRQGGGCSYAVSPTSRSVPASGGSGAIDVAAAGGCAWTAATEASWLSITSGSTGRGDGTVTFTAAPHSGGARSGTLMVAGRLVTLTQAGSCTFEIAPRDASVDAAGRIVDVAVSSPAGCSWTASSHASWLDVDAGTSGSGNGLVPVQVQANSGPARTGTVTIAGHTFTVTQEPAGCTATVEPESVAAPARGGPFRLSVTAEPTCEWTSESAVGWITVTAGAHGKGSGPVLLLVEGNTGRARQGVVTIAGTSVIVRQERVDHEAMAQGTRHVARGTRHPARSTWS